MKASLSNLLADEARRPSKVMPDDVREGRNYVNALDAGMERLDSLPLPLKLVNGVHWSAGLAIRQAAQRLMLHERLQARAASVSRALPLVEALFTNPLEGLGILRETGLQRGRRYLADSVLATIEAPREEKL